MAESKKLKKKKKARIVEISEPNPNGHEPLAAEIEAQYNLFKQIIKEINPNLKPLTLPVALLEYDIEIKKLLNNRQEIIDKIEAFHQNAEKAYQNQKNITGYHESLMKTLVKANEFLSDAYWTLFSIEYKIQQRIRETDAENKNEQELKLNLDNLYNKLKADLTNYISLMSVIEQQQEDNSTDKSYFLKTLQSEIADLYESIKTYSSFGDLNPEYIDGINETLLSHLGVNPSILPSFSELPSINQKEIVDLVDGLFEDLAFYQRPKVHILDKLSNFFSEPDPEEEAEKKLTAIKERIIRMSRFELGIREKLLVIEKYSNYFLLRKEEIKLQAEAKQLHKIIKEEKLNSRIFDLEKHIVLIELEDNNDYPGNQYVISEAKKLLTELYQFQERFEQLKLTKAVMGAENDNAKTRLRKLSASVKLTEVTLTRLKELHCALENPTFKDNFSDQIEQLKLQYKKNKKTITEKIDDAIENADAAYEAAELNHEILKFKINRARETRASIIKRSEENIPLAKLRDQLQPALDDSNEIITEAKRTIISKHCKKYNSLQTMVRGLVQPKFSEQNPFKNDAKRQFKTVKDLSYQLNRQFNAINIKEGNELSTWIKDYKSKENQSRQSIKTSNAIHKNASEIERRLKNSRYILSVNSIEKINLEIQRITEKYLQKAIEKLQLEEHEKRILLEIENNHYQIEEKLEDELVAKIDPRLPVLIKIRKRFEDLNATYINKDLNLLNDEQFLEALITIVEEELHHNHMEIYSEGRRNKLIQWLRIHIIKPVIDFKEQAEGYLTVPTNMQKLGFFVKVTPFATATERCMVNYGNDLAKELNTATACA
jgi:hypothetical protein